MKSFVISSIFIIIIVAFSIFNSVYINNVAIELIDKAQSLSFDDNSIFEYSDLWEKYTLTIRISSSHKETHRITEVIEVLKSKAENKIEAGFNEEKALLIEYINQIKEDETVSLDSII